MPPLSSSKGGPPQRHLAPPEATTRALRHQPLERRVPAARHARGRLQASVGPQLSEGNVSQRPVTHRLPPCLRGANPAGLPYTGHRPAARAARRLSQGQTSGQLKRPTLRHWSRRRRNGPHTHNSALKRMDHQLWDFKKFKISMSARVKFGPLGSRSDGASATTRSTGQRRCTVPGAKDDHN